MNTDYNQRLFSKGLRKRWHVARFNWLRKQLIQDFGPDLANCAVLELGCFDAKTLDYLHLKPRLYMGYDAGWGGGLDYALQRFGNDSTVNLSLCHSPNQIEGNYDLAVCLETLEHLPIGQLDEFLGRLASSAPRLYASVPVEWGPVFIMKHVFKTVTKNRPDSYRPLELLAAAIGLTSAVKRIEGVHKGFDYRDLIVSLRKHYPYVQTFNLNVPGFPLWMSGTVGLVASRHQ